MKTLIMTAAMLMSSLAAFGQDVPSTANPRPSDQIRRGSPEVRVDSRVADKASKLARRHSTSELRDWMNHYYKELQMLMRDFPHQREIIRIAERDYQAFQLALQMKMASQNGR